ncbi:hypothetical protein [Chitinimonas lacunae]|uniref:Uncharacterized protein n=1 Tax=Chitinimonas lacunae TaxID=1963018 RepID=A0ABV8MRU6_9NEIS
MSENLNDIPPAIPLIVDALKASESLTDARKNIKALIPELKQQSEFYYTSTIKTQNKSYGFEIYLDSALDPFSPTGCQAGPCRILQAKNISRSMGLIGDRVWLTDFFTESFLDLGRVTNVKLEKIIGDGLVLTELYPLISAGIIKFQRPFIVSCKGCLNVFENTIDNIVENLLDEYEEEISISHQENGECHIDTGSFFTPTIIINAKAGSVPISATKREITQAVIHRAVRETAWMARNAGIGEGTIFSNSKIGLAGLRLQDGKSFSRKSLAVLDNQNGFDIPWVSNLNPEQILQLRQEACKALPQFREIFIKNSDIELYKDTDGTNRARKEFIYELREQAAEVKAELESAQKHSTKYWKTTFGLIGLGAVAYGAATNQLGISFTGLLAMINLLTTHKSGHEKSIDELTRKPGYVLIKAQDILAHAD